MKVLHIDRGDEMRGGQWQVLRLLRGMLNRKLDAKLMTDPEGPLWKLAAADSIPLIPLGIRALRASHADLIHAHDARSHTFAAMSSPGTRLIVSRRVTFAVKTTLLSRWKYSRPTHFLAISEAVSRELIKAGVQPGKISVVPDGVSIPKTVIPYSHRPWTPHSYVSVATDDQAKGSDLVREAAAIAQVPVQFSSEIADDLERARLFIYLSRNEGLGSAALLAMSFGVPVVASRVGGLVEVIENEVSGLLSENDPPLVAASIRRLVDSPELATRISLAARVRVIERFSEDAMVDRTIAAYDRVMMV